MTLLWRAVSPVFETCDSGVAVAGLLAAGGTGESILKARPYLELPDVDEALHYAACLTEGETIELRR